MTTTAGIFSSAAATLLLAATLGAASPDIPSPDIPSPDIPSPEAPPASAEEQGIEVAMTIEPVEEGAPLQEGTHARVSFLIRDTATGAPMSGLYPAAWMDRIPAVGRGQEGCTEKVTTFLGGSLFSQPELNLNVYYVLGLNDDATITVVDPLFGFGNTKLLALVRLESPGEDWVIDDQRERLYVSLPGAGKVVAVDTGSWKVAAYVETGGTPGRLQLQRDGRRLWTADLGTGEGSVTAIDLETFTVAARLPAGRGQRDLALSSDDRFAYVTARETGTVTVVDGRTLEVAATLPVGADPASIAYSEPAEAAFVSVSGAGEVVVVDHGSQGHRVAARIPVEKGIGQIRFAPSGRFALVVSPAASRVHVVDAASRRRVQSGTVEEDPDQVSFSDELAYVHHRGSEIVLMIPLVQVGAEGQPLSVIDFPGGQDLPEKGAPPSLASAIVQAPGAAAVLVANPADRMIYYYKEGMAAPMGSFRNYGRQPRAVQVVDRSLQEREPGRYETTVKLRRAGDYDVAFFLDAPKAVHCFALQVAPAAGHAPEPEAPRLETLTARREVAPGDEVDLRFRVRAPGTGEPVDGVQDLQGLAFLGPGLWQKRGAVTALGDGVYSFRFTPPEEGIYYVFLHSESLGLAVNRGSYLSLRAVSPEASNTTDEPRAEGASTTTASLP